MNNHKEYYITKTHLPFYLSFGDVGKLILDNDKLRFEGSVDESAKIFIEYLCKIFNGYIENLLEKEREKCYKKYNSKEVLSEEALNYAEECAKSKEKSLDLL